MPAAAKPVVTIFVTGDAAHPRTFWPRGPATLAGLPLDMLRRLGNLRPLFRPAPRRPPAGPEGAEGGAP
jgi:hypothetical protein